MAPKIQPWEYFAIEAMYVDLKDSVTLMLVHRGIDKDAKAEALASCVKKINETGQEPFAIFAIPVTLH